MRIDPFRVGIRELRRESGGKQAFYPVQNMARGLLHLPYAANQFYRFVGRISGPEGPTADGVTSKSYAGNRRCVVSKTRDG